MIIRDDLCNDGQRVASLLDPKTEMLVRKYLPPAAKLSGLSDFFTAFSDPGRLKILSALSISRMCVSDLSAILGMNQTTLSHQLRSLKSARIVSFEKQGKTVFYFIVDPSIMELLLLATKLTDIGA